MGTVYTKGTRTKPRYYLYFREGSNPDGSPRYVQRAAKGVQNKGEARAELARIEAAIARGEAWEHGKQVVLDMKSCLERFRDSLTNRAAYEDKLIITRDLIPKWSGFSIEQVTLREVMKWLDELSTSDLSTQSQNHRIGYLSRFFSWAILNDLTEVNPVKMIPKGKRPVARREKEPDHLSDDSLIPVIMKELGSDLGLMYYVARFSGLREGEAAGLRMSDLDWLHEGVIRVRYSFFGPLKESRDGSKPVKWVPAPTDAEDVLKLHMARRRLNGAGPEDLVFPYQRPHRAGPRSGRVRQSEWKDFAGWHPKQIRTTWRKAAKALSLSDDLTFYGATRHSYVTKALLAGVSLDEVSTAVGHAMPSTTQDSYNHLIRKTFNPLLRQGLASTSGT